jgi:dephospho-CoA kinase
LTGGLASGKSTVASYLRDLGCFVISMDDLGREIQMRGGEAYDAIVREFGPEILTQEREIDRRRLAATVFADPAKLERLNAIVHPIVRARAAVLEKEFFAGSPDGIAVTEAAILVETGTYRDFDKLILAVATPEQQVERAMRRDPKVSREEILNRIARQYPLEQKMKYADYVIDTSGTRENTLSQTQAVYRSLRSLT